MVLSWFIRSDKCNFFNIPLTISNLIAAVVLFFCLWKLALILRLSYFYSLIFALTFCTLTVIIRWLNAVSIDIWVAIFFVLAIILLERPNKSFGYFGKLGFVLGMLIGSKYTAWYYLLLFIFIYFRNILSTLSNKNHRKIIVRIVSFFIPFSIFGLFWYFRNFLLKGNPFYPIQIFGLNGVTLFTDTVWRVIIKSPDLMLNAFFSEYHLWILSIFIAIWYLLARKKDSENAVRRLFMMGIINILFYLTFPTSTQPWIMVSSLRYSYPAFIPIMLGVFILAQQYKRQELLVIFAIASALPLLSMVYYPKLMLIYLPIAFMSYKLIDKLEKRT